MSAVGDKLCASQHKAPKFWAVLGCRDKAVLVQPAFALVRPGVDILPAAKEKTRQTAMTAESGDINGQTRLHPTIMFSRNPPESLCPR